MIENVTTSQIVYERGYLEFRGRRLREGVLSLDSCGLLGERSSERGGFRYCTCTERYKNTVRGRERDEVGMQEIVGMRWSDSAFVRRRDVGNDL
jgi:hypothetical protein